MRYVLCSILMSFLNLSLGCGDTTVPSERQKSDSVTTGKSADSSKQPAKKQEPPESKKKALLRQLIGEYSLHSISGAMGANTLVDYVMTDGKWSASGSSISQARRQGYPIELAADDIQNLNTTKIVVDKDLTVSFVCDGKTYFTAPFSEDGLTYKLTKPPKDFTFLVPKDLTPKSTFIKDVLYLYAEDNIPLVATQPIDFAGVEANAVVISYLQKSKTFEVNVFDGECCNNAIYVFQPPAQTQKE